MRTSLAAAAAVAVLLAAGTAAARGQIRIVGSSTVFPFSTAVAERFAKTTSFKTPVVESTGSGGGLKLFCAGVGVEHPDIANASRRIKPSEVESCAKSAHAGSIPGIEDYVGEFTGETAWGPDGYLADKGLIPCRPPSARRSAPRR